jgi:ATP-dependent Lhr-like helicase
MELGGEVVRGYFVEGLSGEQYALADALDDLDRSARRAEPHVLVNITDPVNLWGNVFALTRPDGTRVSAPRQPHTWLVFRDGRPVVLAEHHGRDLTTLAGVQALDLPGVAACLGSLVERPATLRPVRRLEVATWNGAPVRDTEACAALSSLGFVADGDVMVSAGRGTL